MKLNFAAVSAGIVSTAPIQNIPLKKRTFDMFHHFVVWLAETVGKFGELVFPAT